MVSRKTAEEWYKQGYEERDIEKAIEYYSKALEIDPTYADAWIEKGVILNNLERHEEAIGCCDKALEIASNYASAWYAKGFALNNLERHEEAIGCYDKALEIDPKDAATWYDRGYALANLKRYEEAISCYDKALEIAPNYASAWYDKGLALANLERYEEAIGCYDKALEIAPNYAAAWYDKGFTLTKLERYEEAIGCYDKALEIDPKDAYAWYNKGFVLADLERYEEAIGCHDKALEIDPKDASAWYNKGNALADLERYEEAIGCYDKALEIAPNHASAWYNKGNALANLERYEEAIGCYDKALEIDPKDAAAWYNKGNDLADLERYEEAIGCYDKALEIDPKDAYAWYDKGLALADLERYEKAIGCYDQALEIDPNYTKAWYAKGYTLAKLKKHEEAIGCYDKALEIDPNYTKAWYAKGFALAILKRYEEAIGCYDKVLEIEPNDASAWYKKGFVLAILKRYEEAIGCYDKVLEIDPNDASAWYDKGYALADLKRYEEAIGCCDKALKIKPNYERAKKYRVFVEEMLREQKEKEQRDEEIEIARMTSDFISSIKSEITEIKNSGVKTPKSDELIEQARVESNENNFKRAEELANEAKRIALERKERYNLASDSLSASEKVFNEAKEFGCNVLDFEDRLTNVEQLFDEGAYEEVIETSKRIGEQTKKIREEAKPEIKISLSQTSFKPNAWKRIDNIITNTGTATAKEIKVEYPKERVEIEGLMAAEELKPNEEKTLKIAFRPIHEGEVPLTAKITYLDSDNKEYKEEKTFWISVGTGISTEAEVGVEDQKPIIKRETEFFNGFIRLKISVTNPMSQIITDVSLDLDFDENTLRLDRHEPEYAVKKGKALLGTISPDTGKTVAFYLDPMTCTKAGTEINCRVDYKDAYGKANSTRMERKKVKVVCPIFSTESDINIGRLKDFIKNLPCHDSKVYQIPAGLDKDKLVELCRETIQMHDVRHIRTLRTTDDKTCETWYYGKTKVDKNNIVINACINEETESIEIFAATPAPESLTGLLAELGRSLTKKINVTGKKPEQVVNVSMKDVIIQRSNLLNFCDADGVCSEENIIIEDSVIQRSKIGGVVADASNVAVEGTVVQHTEIEEDEEVGLQEERLRKENEERERLRREEEEKKKERERKEREEAEERELEKQAYHRLHQEMDEIKEKRLKRGN